MAKSLLTYSERHKIKVDSLKFSQQANNLLSKRRPKAIRREKYMELKESLRFSHLSEKDFFWNSFTKKYEHNSKKRFFLVKLDKLIKNVKSKRKRI